MAHAFDETHRPDGSIFAPNGYSGDLEYVSDVSASGISPELQVDRRIATFKDGKLIGIRLGPQSVLWIVGQVRR